MSWIIQHSGPLVRLTDPNGQRAFEGDVDGALAELVRSLEREALLQSEVDDLKEQLKQSQLREHLARSA